MSSDLKRASGNQFNPGLYDAATLENFLLDDCGLFGRRQDLKALLKWLNLARNGQTKTVLISGDPGIGKSAILQTLQEICLQGAYGRVLDLRGFAHQSAERFYCHVLESVNQLAKQILEEALLKINETTQEAVLNWSMGDLLEAIQLVRVQDYSSQQADAGQQDLLVRKIRSSLPATQKIKGYVQQEIEQLVAIVIDPWLTIASGIVSGSNPSVQKAFHQIEQLKQQILLKENPVARALNELLQEVQETAEPHIETEVVLNKSKPALEVEAAKLRAQAPRAAGENDTTQEDLCRHLVKVFQYINKSLKASDKCLMVLMDDWQEVAELPEVDRDSLKGMLASLLKEFTDTNSFHIMVCLSTRPEGQSYSLGGQLYPLFNHKMLLAPLPEMARKKLLSDPLERAGIRLETALADTLFTLTRGNPFWLIQSRRFIQDWAKIAEKQQVLSHDFAEMGIHHLEDFLELGFTRLKLQFMHHDERFYDVLSKLLEHFSKSSFSVQDVINRLGESPTCTQEFIFEVLRSLYLNHFLNDMPSKVASQDPVYAFGSHLVVDYMRRKIQELQPSVTPQDQLHFLKQVIPLSLRAGELDREKTMELIAMNRALGTEEMSDFLEAIFAAHLSDPSPAVRTSALSNMAAIPSDTTIERILACLDDWDESVRQCAVENLSILMDFQGINQGFVTQDVLNRILAALELRTQDEAVPVRALAYQTLGKLFWYSDVVEALVKGVEDDSIEVRIQACTALLKVEPLPEATVAALLKMMQDGEVEVRRLACKGFGKVLDSYPESGLVETLSEFLVGERDESVKVALIQALSGSLNQSLLKAYQRVFERDQSELVRVAILRSLNKLQPGFVQTVEGFLTQIIARHKELPESVLWGAVKTLGEIGESYDTVEHLRSLKVVTRNEILLVALETAIRKVHGRFYHFQQNLDHQLKRARPNSALSNPEKDAIEVNPIADEAEDFDHSVPQDHSLSETTEDDLEAVLS